MLSEPVRNLEKLIRIRAFNEGATAYQAGMPRHAPMKYGVYSSDWTKGYDDAILSTIAKRTVQIDVHVGPLTENKKYL